jgi:catalase
MHSVLWDEAQKISGKDPDFHRRDLYDAIANGDFPEWEFGVQIVPEEDENKFDFDLLDATKLIPEELVPVQRIGKMTLNRRPANFFAESEQVAFHPGHLVPGIDFTNDPLLQGRLFSYTDTQLIRLGGPNFHEIPINRSVVPVHNNQRDGHMRQTIHHSRTSYEPNSLGGGCPMQAGRDLGGFVSYAESINAPKVRARSKSFFDHFSQAQLFYQSQSEPEKDHIVNAFRFELGKVEVPDIRERMIAILNQVDRSLAERVAAGLGLKVPAKIEMPLNRSVPADGHLEDFQPVNTKKPKIEESPALSILKSTLSDSIKSRSVAFLAADGCEDNDLNTMHSVLSDKGAQVKIVSPRLGYLTTAGGDQVKIHFSLLTASSVFFDAIYVVGGSESVETLKSQAEALDFIHEAYKHCKTIAVSEPGKEILRSLSILSPNGDDDSRSGVVLPNGSVESMADEFVRAIAQHRHWDREKKFQIQP